jgi:hypothetical protein
MNTAAKRPLLTLVLLLFTPSAGHSFDILPFQANNQSPIVQIYGLPAIGNSRVLEASEIS